MVIGLYDLDLWGVSRSTPNLDLMKIYNYYYQAGHKVIMMKPNDKEGRFNHIIYFKEHVNTKFSSKLVITGENKTIRGYGFYGKYAPLKPEIEAAAPSYEPYDLYSYKLKTCVGSYDKLKKDSLVRVQTNDLTDFKPKRKNIIIVDRDFLQLPNGIDFLQEYKNHTFYFYHSPVCKTKEQFYELERYLLLINSQAIIDFQYDEDFFLENFKNNKVFFKNEKRENETEQNYYLRLIKTILLFKKESMAWQTLYKYNPKNDFEKKIVEWGRAANNKSFEETYGAAATSNLSTEIRLLLKQDPKKVESSTIDFSKNL